MSQKKTKQTRKQIRKAARLVYNESIEAAIMYFNSQPLFRRIVFAWRLLFGNL